MVNGTVVLCLTISFVLGLQVQLCVYSLVQNPANSAQQREQAPEYIHRPQCKAEMVYKTYRPKDGDCDRIRVNVTGCYGDCNSGSEPTWLVRGLFSPSHPHLSVYCNCCLPLTQKTTSFEVKCPRSRTSKNRRVEIQQITECTCKRCS